MQACSYVYNPVEPTSFIVTFDGSSNSEQRQRAATVIAHLDALDAAALIEESIKFFKWIVLFPTSTCNLLYAETLLKYFHGSSFQMHCITEVDFARENEIN